MISETLPPNFNPRCEVVSCFVQHGGRFLLLHRCDTDGEMHKWGLPAGKIDPGETPEQAIIREVEEETSIKLTDTKFKFFKKIYVRYPTYDFVFHIFQTDVDTLPGVKLNPREHSAFQWFTREETTRVPLVRNLGDCITLFFSK